MSKMKNTQKREDRSWEKFQDKSNEIDQMFDFGIITEKKRDQMKQELMGVE